MYHLVEGQHIQERAGWRRSDDGPDLPAIWIPIILLVQDIQFHPPSPAALRGFGALGGGRTRIVDFLSIHQTSAIVARIGRSLLLFHQALRTEPGEVCMLESRRSLPGHGIRYNIDLHIFQGGCRTIQGLSDAPITSHQSVGAGTGTGPGTPGGGRRSGRNCLPCPNMT